MSLGTATLDARQGVSASRAWFMTRLTFAGDDAYVAGGTTNFAAYVATSLGVENVRVMHVQNGLHAGATAGGVAPGLAEVVYDAANDALIVRSRATGTEATDGDLSALTLEVVVVHY